MLVFNTFIIINMKEKHYNINSDDVYMHHYNPHHYRRSKKFTPCRRLLPSNKTKKAKFALLSLIKWFPWQPYITFLLNFMLLDEGYIDVPIYGFILIPFNTK